MPRIRRLKKNLIDSPRNIKKKPKRRLKKLLKRKN